MDAATQHATPEVAEPPRMRPYDPTRPVIFTHIPKCAGTSFVRLLRQWFGKSYAKLNQDETRDILLPRVSLTPTDDRPPVACIHGHFDHGRGYGLPYYYPGVDQYFTVFRDPFDLVVSMYFFAKGRSLEGRFWYRGKQVNLLDQYPTVEHYLRDFPYWLYNHLPQDITIADYREKLARRFIYIGIQEDLRSSIRNLGAILGKPYVELGRFNESSYDEPVPTWLREQFYHDYPLLKAIYDFARETYNDPQAWTVRAAESPEVKNPPSLVQ